MSETLYKICPRDAWRQAVEAGAFAGAPVDMRDGYIHFSTSAQVTETAAKHFAGQEDLMLVAVDAAALGEALRWEPSRGGALFPHLYGPLAMTAVLSAEALPLGPGGAHLFPQGIVS
ncbi:MAG TPA: DUF952 domain-containing protein [Rhizobiales bacterium]|nr:DUF952 domain-containing protein [Hyphomicrobiales bacterium]